jgi:16S rRNA (cytidine1402-2'-O)-methyltransferase
VSSLTARGCLTLVATPIGNLDDLSPRAAEALRAADRVLAEDTRRARNLLSHLGISGKAVDRLDAEVESRGVQRWLALLADGQSLAMVSDAGTPVVSDPGATLVRAAAAQGSQITALPGPSAVTTAIAASGFAGDRFRFFGFLPRSGSERRQLVALVHDTEETVALFESPQRIAKTLAELAVLMPEREAVVARELSKLHEELVRGTVQELVEREAGREWRGEITLVLAPARRRQARMDEATLDAHIGRMRGEGMRAKEISKALSLNSGWTARDIYQRMVTHEEL